MPLAPAEELIAFNKIDQADIEHLELAKQEYPTAVFISAKERIGLDNLRSRLMGSADY